jgi:hypothetical protein
MREHSALFKISRAFGAKKAEQPLRLAAARPFEDPIYERAGAQLWMEL